MPIKNLQPGVPLWSVSRVVAGPASLPCAPPPEPQVLGRKQVEGGEPPQEAAPRHSLECRSPSGCKSELLRAEPVREWLPLRGGGLGRCGCGGAAIVPTGFLHWRWPQGCFCTGLRRNDWPRAPSHPLEGQWQLVNCSMTPAGSWGAPRPALLRVQSAPPPCCL